MISDLCALSWALPGWAAMVPTMASVAEHESGKGLERNKKAHVDSSDESTCAHE